MRPVTIGIVAAAAVIIAFIAGTQIEYAQKGPAEKAAEKVGEAIDKAAGN